MNDVACYERCEMAAWGSFMRAAPEQAVSFMKTHVEEIGGSLVCIAAEADVLALNRVIGLGLNEPATIKIINNIIEIFREKDVKRFFIQVAPAAKPDNLCDMLLERGLTHYNNWIRLSRDVNEVPDIETSLKILKIEREHAEAFGELTTECFGWPPEMGAIVGAVVGHNGWHHYMALNGDVPVATAALFKKGDVGWFDFATTHEAHRGKGAQKALAVRRIRDAAHMGICKIIVETSEQKPGKEAISYKNMMKLGFKVDYVRPNFIYVR